MSKEKEIETIDKAIKYSGLGLMVIMLLAHVFYKEIDLLVLLIPALMVGLDVRNLLNK